MHKRSSRQLIPLLALLAGLSLLLISTHAQDWASGRRYQTRILPQSDKIASSSVVQSVAGSETLVVVGAVATDRVGSGRDEMILPVAPAAAYVYTRVGDGWLLEQRLDASGELPEVGNELEWQRIRVALHTSREAVFVADMLSDGPGGFPESGCVYIYTRSVPSEAEFNASTPVTWTRLQTIAASDATNGNYFGSALALHPQNDLVVVGAMGVDSATPSMESIGAVYVFAPYQTSGLWIQIARLVMEFPAAGDLLGSAVAVNADGAVLVGAPGSDWLSSVDRGSAVVYTLDLQTDVESDRVKHVQYLTASDLKARDSFGCAVAITTRHALVSSSSIDPSSVDGKTTAGSVYVYLPQRPASADPETTPVSWILKQTLRSTNSRSLDFGYSLGLTANMLCVGAPVDGKVFTYSLDGKLELWESQQIVDTPTTPPASQFAHHIAINSKYLLVDAYTDVRVYSRSGTTIGAVESNPLFTSDLPSSSFGSRIASTDTHAIVGVPDDTVSGAEFVGAVYFYSRTGHSWGFVSRFVSPEPSSPYRFGFSVAISGTTAAAGCPYCNNARGKVVTFDYFGTNWLQMNVIDIPETYEGSAYFGITLTIGPSFLAIGTPAIVKERVNPNGVGVDNYGGVVYSFTMPQDGTSPQFLYDYIPGNNQFGSYVASFDNKLLINRPNTAISVYTRAGNLWSKWNELNPGPVLQNWGHVFAHSATHMIVSSFQDNKILMYRLDTDVYVQEKIIDLTGMGAVNFGYLLDLKDRFAVICGFEKTYIYEYIDSDWVSIASFTATSAYLTPSLDYRFRGLSNALYVERAYEVTDNRSPTIVHTAIPETQSRSISVSVSPSAAPPSPSAAPSFSPSPHLNVAECGKYRPTTPNSPPSGWVEQARLEDKSLSRGSQFGTSAAIAENYAIVGAPGSASGELFGAGVAIIYSRSGITWAFQQKLEAPTPAQNDCFGCSVGISQTLAIIGAPGLDAEEVTGAGRSFVYTRSSTTWSLLVALSMPTSSSNAFFGVSVMITRAVAYCMDKNGMVYSFTRTGGDFAYSEMHQETLLENRQSANYFISGLPETAGFTGQAVIYADPTVYTDKKWIQYNTLVASNGASGDLFGYSAVVDGELIAVGAPRATVENIANVGSVYVFTSSSSTWIQSQILTPANPSAGQEFGYSVAMTSTLLVVGSPHEDQTQAVDTGSVSIYTRNAGSWVSPVQVQSPGGTDFERFGASVAIVGAAVAVGSPGVHVGAYPHQGAVHIYTLASGTWALQQTITFSDPVGYLYFGDRVYTASSTSLLVKPENDHKTYTFGFAGDSWVLETDSSIYNPITNAPLQSDRYRLYPDVQDNVGKGAVHVEYNPAIVSPSRKSIKKL